MASPSDRPAPPTRLPSGPSAFATPAPGHLNADQVRNACAAPNTKKAYRSYIKGIASWIRETQESPDQFFEQDGSINLSVFAPSRFEKILMYKMNGRALKVSTLSTWIRPTGIPPHVELFEQHKETRTAQCQLPDVLLDGFAKLLEERCIGQARVTRETLGSTIRSLLQEAGLWQSQASVRQELPSRASCTTYYWPADGRFHRMPMDFVFPQLDALGVWYLWWLGNPAAGHPPFRALHTIDFTPSDRKMCSEWCVLVRHITTGFEAGGTGTMQRPGTQQEADRLFHLGITNLPMKASANPHKQRLERANTTLRRI